MWRSTSRTAKGVFHKDERQSGPEARSSRESAANVGSKATRRQSVTATRKFASNVGRKTILQETVQTKESHKVTLACLLECCGVKKLKTKGQASQDPN